MSVVYACLLPVVRKKDSRRTIMTVTTARSRVFVSSVVEGFAEYRQAARSGIEQAGGEAVLVNEDFPA
jgi:hypothetical protein